MLHVLLDTSIYHHDPQRRRAGFQTLTALCEERAVILHVPAIVKREFVSHFAIKAESRLAETLAAVKRLLKTTPNEAADSVREFIALLEGLDGKFGKHVEERFESWLHQVHAEIHEVRPECVNDILDNYFSGGPPFKKIKNRDDFPDAFVWQNVNDLASEHNELLVVVADCNLREAISSIAKVEVFVSLDELIESQKVQPLYFATFARAHTDPILQIVKADNAFMNQALLDGVNAEVVDNMSLNYRDDEETRIVDISQIVSSKFDFDNARYYGENIFRIPFEAEVDATLDYFLLKTSYYTMPDEESNAIDIEDSDWNESYMWVSESRILTISGILAITIDTTEVIEGSQKGQLDPDLVKDHSEVTVDEIDSLEIKYEGPM